MKSLQSDRTKNWLYKEMLYKEHGSMLNIPMDPLCMADIEYPSDGDLSTVWISTTIWCNIQKVDNLDDNKRKALTLAMISEEHCNESWIHVYIDGSATDAITDGRAGIAGYRRTLHQLHGRDSGTHTGQVLNSRIWRHYLTSKLTRAMQQLATIIIVMLDASPLWSSWEWECWLVLRQEWKKSNHK